MYKSAHSFIMTALFSSLLVCLPIGAFAQSTWLLPAGQSNVSLEIYKADWDEEVIGISFATSVWFFSVEQYLSPTIAVVGEIPFSHADRKVNELYPWIQDIEAQNKIGNPYVGLKIRGENTFVIGELGIRMPLTSEKKSMAASTALFSEFDRWEAFIPNLTAFRARIGAESANQSALINFRVLGGGTFWIPTEDGENLELFGDLISKVWVQSGQFTGSIDVAVKSLVTAKRLSFTERSEFQVGASVAMTQGSVRPGIHVHIPLGDEGLNYLGSIVDATYGANITVLFGHK